MHPLDGPRLKVRRTKSEIQALRDAEDTFRQNTKYHIVRSEFNPKTGKYVYRVRIQGPPPDPDWGVWIGEMAHNLRSALDGLIYQLASLNPKTPTWDTRQQFPIFLRGRSRLPFRNAMYHQFEWPINANGKTVKRRGDGRDMIHNLCPEHQTRIERLQPYKSGKGGRSCPLWWLHEVNNADKHRLIQVFGAKTGMPPIAGSWREHFDYPFDISPGHILEDGAKYGEAPFDVQVYPKLIPLIAFWYGCPEVQGKAVVNTFRIIADDVSNIVEDFSLAFD